MTSPSCQAPIEWATLIDYWLGELPPDSEAGIEAHYLCCAECSRRLERLATLARGIGDLARTSGVDMVINDEILLRLKQDGLKVREYHVPNNGSVNCTVAPEDDFVIGRLEAPLSGLGRVDLLTLDSEGNTLYRQQNVPFLADSGGVIMAPGIEKLRAMPASTLHFRLLAVDDQGERILGDYIFNHSPYEPN